MIRTLKIVCILLLIHPVRSAPFIQEIGASGVVNWTEFLIRTKGEGNVNLSLPQEVRRKSALDAARKDALVEVLQSLNQIDFDSDLTVGELLASHDSLHIAAMNTVSENLRIVDRVYLPDGSIELEVELSILGSLMSLLLPEAGDGHPLGTKLHQETFTGVVIDARGLNLNPSLLPRVLNEDGVEIYGRSFIAHTTAIEIGVCGWVKDSLNLKDKRLGDSPFIIKAKDITGENLTDMVISNKDAEMLHGSPKSLAILEACKLSVLLN